MKWFVASDLHGSAFYCEKMLEAFRREEADRLLLLGDLLYHGPRNDLPEAYRPKEVIRLLNEFSSKYPVYAVRGNCDAEVDQLVLSFPIQADYCLLSVGNRVFYATHGHLPAEQLPLGEGDGLLTGHTHIPELREEGSRLYLNPGSVSLPKEGRKRCYMVLTEEGIFLKELDGNLIKELRGVFRANPEK